MRERGARALVIAAPPRTLADLRDALHPHVKARIVLEMNRDFTKQPVWEIERHVVASQGQGRPEAAFHNATAGSTRSTRRRLISGLSPSRRRPQPRSWKSPATTITRTSIRRTRRLSRQA